VRILYHHRTLADGAEGIHIAAIVGAFRALGHEVRVLGVTPQRHQTGSPTLLQTVRSGLPDAAFEVGAVALNALEYASVARQIGQFKPAFLYSRHARLDIAALAAARRARIPSVLELNSLFTQGAYHEHEPMTLYRLAVRLERRALALATVVVAVSTPLARQAEALVSRPVCVLPNGVDAALFDPRRADPGRIRVQHGLQSRFIVGWTGIIREWHGLDVLLEAVAVVPDAHLLIVGDGPSRTDLERRAAARGIGARLTITGRVAHEEMPDYVGSMDVAVVADERTAIASPMKLLEYMAMERPVVAPRLDNIADLVCDGADGLLFTPGDSVDLASALRRLGGDESLRDRLGHNARAKVEREHTWRRKAEDIIALATEGSARIADVRADKLT